MACKATDSLSTLRLYDEHSPNRISAMRYTVIALTPLFASFGLLVLGHGLLGTLLAVRMTDDGFSAQSIGLVSACYSIGFIVGTRLDGYAIRNVRHIRTFAALSATAASITLAFALFVSPLFWAVMRLLYGVCLAGLYMVIESWLNANTPWSHRGKILALYSVITYMALGGGQFLLVLANPQSTNLFLLAAILICLSLVPLTLARINSPELPEIRPVRLLEIYRLQPYGLAGALSSGVIIGSFLGFGPVFAKDNGFSSLQISLFMGLTISGGFLLQWPIGLLSDRYRRDRVISVVALFVAGLSLAIILLTGAITGVVAVIAPAVLWGAFSFTLYPISVALVNDHLASSQFVQASAGLLLTNSLGMVAGNLTAGQLVAFMGPQGLFWIAAFTALALAVFARLHRQIPAPPEVSYFRALPRNSPYASALDPRGDAGVQLQLDFDGTGTPKAATKLMHRSAEGAEVRNSMVG